MLSIVVIGAGDVGRYIASLLSKEEHNVILVDKDSQKLEEAAFNLDIATRQGSGTDWQLLDDLMELSPSFLIALTDDDETNLVACSIAKGLGYPRTVARVRDNRYFNRTRLDFGRLFDVDYFVGPELLVAQDILKYIVCPASLAVENFAHGAVQMRTLAVPDKWRKEDVPLRSLNMPQGMMVGLICRNQGGQNAQVIFPHGNDCLKHGDEVTFIGDADAIGEAHRLLGISQKVSHSVVIVGGSLTTINLARLLRQRDIHVKVIDKDVNVCRMLSEQLPDCIILHHDPSDVEFLKAEKIGGADVVATCTRSDEINMMVGLLVKQVGCQDVVAMLSNTSYVSLVPQLGLNYTVSPRISAANQILSQIFSGQVNSLVSLYENQAEVLEITVSVNSHIVGIPISELGPLLPKDFLIAMIQNRGRVMIANGNRVISPGDTVVVITSPKHVKELEKIF